MPRFTPATEAALLAAGWFEGRTVPDEQMDDWLIINWLPHSNMPPRGYSKISLAAWRVLNEFGGLSIERAGSINGEPLVINPLAVVDCGSNNYELNLEFYSWRIGTEVFPIGTIDFDIDSVELTFRSTAVVMSADGRFFLLTHWHYQDKPIKPIRFLGSSIEEALEKLVAGDNGEPVDDFHIKQFSRIATRVDAQIRAREKQLMRGQWPDQTNLLGRNATSGFYAISDWATEAATIMAAFGIAEPCVFDGPTHYKSLRLASKSNITDSPEPALGNGLYLRLAYTSYGRFFRVLDPTHKRLIVCDAKLHWDGHSLAQSENDSKAAALALAKGLCRLGLLIPEVERNLKVTITQHEKLEWQLEFEAFKDSA